MKTSLPIALVLAIATMLGCGGENRGAEEINNTPLRVDTQPALEAEGLSPMAEMHLELLLKRAQWTTHKIAEYEITFTAEAAQTDATELVLHVADEQLLSVYLTQTGEFISPTDYQGLGSVKDIFDTVEELINSMPDTLTLEYDETYGFPKSIFMDYRHSWPDDQYSWSFRQFNVIRHGISELEAPLRAAPGVSEYLTF